MRFLAAPHRRLGRSFRARLFIVIISQNTFLFSRKEYVHPELDINALWRVYFMDEKWCQLQSRKKNIKRLVPPCWVRVKSLSRSVDKHECWLIDSQFTVYCRIIIIIIIRLYPCFLIRLMEKMQTYQTDCLLADLDSELPEGVPLLGRHSKYFNMNQSWALFRQQTILALWIQIRIFSANPDPSNHCYRLNYGVAIS